MCCDFIFVNGDNIKEKMEVFNMDRIIFGTNSTFLLVAPG